MRRHQTPHKCIPLRLRRRRVDNLLKHLRIHTLMDIKQRLMTLLPHFTLRIPLRFCCIFYNRHLTIIDKNKNIWAPKQHTHPNRPPIPILSVKYLKLCIQTTVSAVHLHSCANYSVLTNTCVFQSLRIKIVHVNLKNEINHTPHVSCFPVNQNQTLDTNYWS